MIGTAITQLPEWDILTLFDDSVWPAPRPQSRELWDGPWLMVRF